MKVSFEKAFSILDGRLSTEMGDVFKMLNYIFDTEFHTLELPIATRKLQQANPKWFAAGVATLEEIRSIVGSNDFESLIKYIQENCSSPDYDIELGRIDVNSGFAKKPKLSKDCVKEGDFVIHSSKKGYSPKQREEAMQVMETRSNTMTVKCKGGCMTKEYDHFEKVEDLSKFSIIHRFEGKKQIKQSNR